jgi:hypothetical protein
MPTEKYSDRLVRGEIVNADIHTPGVVPGAEVDATPADQPVAQASHDPHIEGMVRRFYIPFNGHVVFLLYAVHELVRCPLQQAEHRTGPHIQAVREPVL